MMGLFPQFEEMAHLFLFGAQVLRGIFVGVDFY